MKSPFAALAFLGTLAASAVLCETQALAQASGRVPRSPYGDTVGSAAAPAAPDPGTPGPARDNVVPNGNQVPELTPADELKPPAIALPNEDVTPYLITKAAGPFMVLARVFRGPDAQQMAILLAKELRTEYGLPAYILRKKEYPGGSMVRGNLPTAPSEVMTNEVKLPEKIRTFDEAAVLVGDEKTLSDQEKLWRAVKKIKPKCLEKFSSPYPWRTGLASALRTTNPYVPAQNLFPHPPDRLIMQMNTGPRSIVNCPGRFSLQVAEFSGRSSFNLNPTGGPTHILTSLRDSPLQTAHDDAEKTAERLARAPEIRRLGQPVYVYHDRSASKVFIGSFNSPQDPQAGAVRNQLIHDAYDMSNKVKRGKAATDTMIVPALALTDLNDIKTKIKN